MPFWGACQKAWLDAFRERDRSPPADRRNRERSSQRGESGAIIVRWKRSERGFGGRRASGFSPFRRRNASRSPSGSETTMLRCWRRCARFPPARLFGICASSGRRAVGRPAAPGKSRVEPPGTGPRAAEGGDCSPRPDRCGGDGRSRGQPLDVRHRFSRHRRSGTDSSPTSGREPDPLVPDRLPAKELTAAGRRPHGPSALRNDRLDRNAGLPSAPVRPKASHPAPRPS